MILNGWKEIARFLGRGVRTTQRWEKELGLPIRRPRARQRTAVVARSEELQQWLDTSSEKIASEDGDANFRPHVLPRFLAVIDSQSNSYEYCRLLAERGFHVVEVCSVSEAMQVASKEHPDLLLMEPTMLNALRVEGIGKMMREPATPIPFRKTSSSMASD